MMGFSADIYYWEKDPGFRMWRLCSGNGSATARHRLKAIGVNTQPRAGALPLLKLEFIRTTSSLWPGLVS
jgi:hypothetical protein